MLEKVYDCSPMAITASRRQPSLRFQRHDQRLDLATHLDVNCDRFERGKLVATTGQLPESATGNKASVHSYGDLGNPS